MLARISSPELVRWRAYFDLLDEETRESELAAQMPVEDLPKPKPKPKVIPLD